MKGMLDFLEKAGLVKKDLPEEQTSHTPPVTGNPSPRFDGTTPSVGNNGTAVALNLDEIYANEGVDPSVYPAERLLRLVDGLSAMDEATRLMAIKAMDAADESWSIEDPLADAAAKVKALSAHSDRLALSLQQLAHETQTRRDAVAARQEQVVGDIRKQIAELEGLVARELARSAAETTTQEANLQEAKDQTARELAEIAQVCQRLQGLDLQFGAPATPPKD